MKPMTLLEGIGCVSDELLLRSAETGRRPRQWLRFAAGAAAVLVLAAAGIVLYGRLTGSGVCSTQIAERSNAADDAALSQEPGGSEGTPSGEAAASIPYGTIDGVTVRPMEAGEGGVSASADLVYLTEEEIFDWSTDVFSGTVTAIDNIVLDFGGQYYYSYRAVVTVEVEQVYRGGVTAGEAVTILMPGPIGDDSVWIEDTEAVSRLRVGSRGIFLAVENGEGQYMEMNGRRIQHRDVARFSVPDGARFVFLDGPEGPVYSEWAFPSLEAETFADVAAYVEKMTGE